MGKKRSVPRYWCGFPTHVLSCQPASYLQKHDERNPRVTSWSRIPRTSLVCCLSYPPNGPQCGLSTGSSAWGSRLCGSPCVCERGMFWLLTTGEAVRVTAEGLGRCRRPVGGRSRDGDEARDGAGPCSHMYGPRRIGQNMTAGTIQDEVRSNSQASLDQKTVSCVLVNVNNRTCGGSRGNRLMSLWLVAASRLISSHSFSFFEEREYNR